MNDYSDPTLLTEVRRYGKFDPAGCLDCGTCTLRCDLSGDLASFPRRLTRQVLLGLRHAVQESLDPWICHDCGDCSTFCPRQTEPCEAMATLRRYLAALYDWTGISARINSSTAWHVGALSSVGASVLVLILLFHVSLRGVPLSVFLSTPKGLEHMFPLMTYLTLGVILLPFLLLLTNAVRMYWFTVHRKDSIRSPFSQWIFEVKTLVLHFFTYKKMVECPTEKGRWIKHFLLASGCMIILAMLVFSLRWFQTDTLFPLQHPRRWIGYLATAFLISGTVGVLAGRARKEKENHTSPGFEDWTFPLLLLATAVTGIMVHIFRYAGFPLAVHYAFVIHMMIAVPMLVVEMPFGKWTHMAYRPLAMYFQSLKEKGGQRQFSPERAHEYDA